MHQSIYAFKLATSNYNIYYIYIHIHQAVGDRMLSGPTSFIASRFSSKTFLFASSAARAWLDLGTGGCHWSLGSSANLIRPWVYKGTKLFKPMELQPQSQLASLELYK